MKKNKEYILVIRTLKGQVMEEKDISILGEFQYHSRLSTGIYLLQLTNNLLHLSKKSSFSGNQLKGIKKRGMHHSPFLL